jgi:hypothetical protein
VKTSRPRRDGDDRRCIHWKMLAACSFPQNKTINDWFTDFRHFKKLFCYVIEEFPIRVHSPQNLRLPPIWRWRIPPARREAPSDNSSNTGNELNIACSLLRVMIRALTCLNHQRQHA